MPGNAPTHREIHSPQVTARYLAEYMCASARRQRSILRDSKYQPIAPLPQHTDAKIVISRWCVDNTLDLYQESSRLRNKQVSGNFQRTLLDNNADYIDRFASIRGNLILPSSDITVHSGNRENRHISGVKVNVEIHLLLQRHAKSNRTKIGLAVLRYSKGSGLNPVEAHWHASFLHEFWKSKNTKSNVDVEKKLCLVIDAYSGKCYEAPSDSRSRYLNMEAACKTIRDQWSNVQKPRHAILA